MSLLSRAFTALVLLLCSTSAVHASPRMTLGAEAAAPEAYIAFCQRRPTDCGDDRAKVLADARTARVAWIAAVYGKTGSIAAPAPVAATADVRPSMGPGLWGKLVTVNAEVNRAIRPQLDRVTYGVGDFWETPLEGGQTAGDCEDYVLEKIRALLALGVPRSALSIAVATTNQGEDHAVLIVTTRQGDFVLDNLSASVRRWDDVPYTWHIRQVDGEAFRWARIAAQ